MKEEEEDEEEQGEEKKKRKWVVSDTQSHAVASLLCEVADETRSDTIRHIQSSFPIRWWRSSAHIPTGSEEVTFTLIYTLIRRYQKNPHES